MADPFICFNEAPLTRLTRLSPLKTDQFSITLKPQTSAGGDGHLRN